MMAELCFHVLDIIQNSYRAESSFIDVHIKESVKEDVVEFRFSDNGRGMDQATLESVQEPFFTTKSGKKVGLGIPLLKETAERCEGHFYIKSQKGEGTEVVASFRKSHIDRPPVGDLAGTVLSVVSGIENADVKFVCRNDEKSFEISINEIKAQAGDISLSSPEVFSFLRAYISEGLEFFDVQ